MGIDYQDENNGIQVIVAPISSNNDLGSHFFATVCSNSDLSGSTGGVLAWRLWHKTEGPCGKAPVAASTGGLTLVKREKFLGFSQGAGVPLRLLTHGGQS